MVDIHDSVWVAPGVQVYGEVSIGEGSSLWPNAVIRCECLEVRIGRVTSIQDFAMVHVDYDTPTIIGDFCTIAHHATIHGATVSDQCLVGVNATIMGGAVIGEGSIVAGGAFVKEGSVFPRGSIIAGIPAVVVRERDSARLNRLNAWVYHRNAQAYRRGEHRAWEGLEFEAWKAEKWRAICADEDLAGLVELAK